LCLAHRGSRSHVEGATGAESRALPRHQGAADDPAPRTTPNARSPQKRHLRTLSGLPGTAPPAAPESSLKRVHHSPSRELSHQPGPVRWQILSQLSTASARIPCPPEERRVRRSSPQPAQESNDAGRTTPMASPSLSASAIAARPAFGSSSCNAVSAWTRAPRPGCGNQCPDHRVGRSHPS